MIEHYHYSKENGAWGRYRFVRNTWRWEEANYYLFPDYPTDADLYSVERFREIDYNLLDKHTPYDPHYDDKFYYGWKECQELGYNYTHPNPENRNNL